MFFIRVYILAAISAKVAVMHKIYLIRRGFLVCVTVAHSSGKNNGLLHVSVYICMVNSGIPKDVI